MIPVEVKLWGTTIGALTQEDGDDFAFFEYNPDFVRSGIEPAPVTMPVRAGTIYRFPDLSPATFHKLPGLFADSIPDKFGNKIIDQWLVQNGREPKSFTALERLCYTGSRGMGALEFFPATGPDSVKSEPIEIERLRALAANILDQRKKVKVKLREKDAFEQIVRVGSSAGGARAKVLIAYDDSTGNVLSGQVRAPEGYGYWLLKFDDIENNRDKENADPAGFGALEYTYSQIAKEAGIQMTECRLLEDGEHRHFITRRFDRTENGGKLHYQSLAAIAHYDFNIAGAYSYEQAFAVARQIGLATADIEQMYRRAVFNICARNQDDHTKNIGFLMDKRGNWMLAPAFDVTYAYNPAGRWTGTHQMTFNGKREKFTLDDFKEVAKSAGLVQGRYKRILEQVQDSLASFKKRAKANDVPKKLVQEVEKNLVRV
ncbi:MAG: type II toxin-antitoxin system HipA family toxin [Fibrobacter sp.]|uniref:type II toxin-antitoxin system HipA family toxin n=1 Tax=Fibrobacter sp. TaxID=35828 RepID=UPI001B05D2D2|nr:type II toxin-antitoxin system HipA family toxin [Fibrobacter sp.]MBO7060707.1 type II toxin-antitoxin system HipA family toxin [Fibrobacter sp.]